MDCPMSMYRKSLAAMAAMGKGAVGFPLYMNPMQNPYAMVNPFGAPNYPSMGQSQGGAESTHFDEYGLGSSTTV